jgi:ubiquinone/menaquinone biosynthesis C-methylase UbiE
METARDLTLTYKAHGEDPDYVKANEQFIARQPLGHVHRFLDLACGSGTVSEILMSHAPQAHLTGIDLDPVQIGLVTERFQRRGYRVESGYSLPSGTVDGKPVLSFQVGSADELPFPEGSFDCVTISNAIHLMPDKDKFLAAVSRVLRPGGLFGFNTVFYAGTLCEGTHGFYTEWLQRAVLYVDQINERLRAEDKPPVKRVRGTTRKALQNTWLSPKEWTGKLAEHGIQVHDTYERTLVLDAQFFASAGAYSGLAEVLMSGYPIEVASEALGSTAAPALAAVNQTLIPRNWLEVWATRA